MVLPMSISSFLMASVFAVSASVQLNDPDWYFWITLYTCGCLVNLMSCCVYPSSRFSSTTIRVMGTLALLLGSFLFVKVMLEASSLFAVGSELSSSFDMRERVVREKLGSGLVITSMVFQLAAASITNDEPTEMKLLQIQTHIGYGIRVVVAVVITCVLSFIFLVFIICSLIMDSASSTVLEDSHAPWLVKLTKYVDYGTLFLICLCYVLSHLICVVFVVSMALSDQTGENSNSIDYKNLSNENTMRKKLKAHAAYGMATLTGITFGLSGIFHVYHKDEMKF